jgi:hypothetical protein
LSVKPSPSTQAQDDVVQRARAAAGISGTERARPGDTRRLGIDDGAGNKVGKKSRNEAIRFAEYDLKRSAL